MADSNKDIEKKTKNVVDVSSSADKVAHSAFTTDNDASKLTPVDHSHMGAQAASAISAATYAATSISILGSALLIIATILKIKDVIQKKAQDSKTRGMKIALNALGIGVTIAALAVTFVAPVVLLGLAAVSSLSMFFQIGRALFRAQKGLNDLQTLIDQKQEKLKNAEKVGDQVRIDRFQKEIKDLKTYNDPEEGEKRLNARVQIEKAKKEFENEKKTVYERLKANPGAEETNEETTQLNALREKIVELEKAYNAMPGVSILKKQREKVINRRKQMILQGVTAAIFVMGAIPFPPIQIVAGILGLGLAIYGMAKVVSRYRTPILNGLKNFAKNVREEARAGFPKIREFFRGMFNAVLYSVGAKPFPPRQPDKAVKQTEAEVEKNENTASLVMDSHAIQMAEELKRIDPNAGHENLRADINDEEERKKFSSTPSEDDPGLKNE